MAWAGKQFHGLQYNAVCQKQGFSVCPVSRDEYSVVLRAGCVALSVGSCLFSRRMKSFSWMRWILACWCRSERSVYRGQSHTGIPWTRTTHSKPLWERRRLLWTLWCCFPFLITWLFMPLMLPAIIAIIMTGLDIRLQTSGERESWSTPKTESTSAVSAPGCMSVKNFSLNSWIITSAFFNSIHPSEELDESWRNCTVQVSWYVEKAVSAFDLICLFLFHVR